MTGKERLLAAITGKKVDRPPIWLREGFNIGGPIQLEPMGDVLGEGGDVEFTSNWKLDPIYRDLFEFVSPHVDVMKGWDIGGHINRFLMIPPEHIKRRVEQVDDDTIDIYGSVETPRGALTFKDQLRRGFNTYWHIEHLVKSTNDLKKLADIPFDFNPEVLPPYMASYRQTKGELGNRGIMRIEYPSPVVAVSATMELEEFLAFSVMENDLLHELLTEITRRLLVITDAIFGNHKLETLVNFGGSEQCTPPLMSPSAFDEFIVPYDGKIIARLKEYGIPVSMHCHGKVCRALKSMIEMGVDSTDPVEPPPAGDVTFAEAREIAQDRLTLIGNLEFDELENKEPDYIASRVKEILNHGSERLVIGSSAGPIHALTPRIAANYRSWINTYLEHLDN